MRILLLSALLLCSVCRVSAWDAHYEIHPDSKILSRLGCFIRFQPPMSANPAEDEKLHEVFVYFDPDQRLTKVLMGQPVSFDIIQIPGGSVYHDERPLARFTDPISYQPDLKGWPTKKFGLKFRATGRLIKQVQLNLFIYDTAAAKAGQPEEDISGGYTLWLREFIEGATSPPPSQ